MPNLKRARLCICESTKYRESLLFTFISSAINIKLIAETIKIYERKPYTYQIPKSSESKV